MRCFNHQNIEIVLLNFLYIYSSTKSCSVTCSCPLASKGPVSKHSLPLPQLYPHSVNQVLQYNDKMLLEAIREQGAHCSISLSSNPRSSIDFRGMRNGRRGEAQSDITMGLVSLYLCVCVCVKLCENQQGTNWCQDKVQK